MKNKFDFGKTNEDLDPQQQYPSSYNIATRKSDTVETVLSRTLLNVSFRRYLRAHLEQRNFIGKT
jgi:hypothetical protein